MFGKPAFGSPAPNTSFGFGASTSTANPFGQTQNLFNKPAAPAFGSATTSTFGQPTSTSLFPATQSNPTNLFQNANTTFGAAPSTQTGFGTTNLFGQPQQTATGGLFNTSSTFGQQAKPTGFGFGTTQTQPSLFGQQQQQQQQQPSLFQSSSSGLFGASTGFGAQQTGSVIKYTPVNGTDTMIKSGVTQTINTKHHCITCMKEYENKSFEELRYEDYQANRKGPQQQAGFGGAPFGATASSAPSLFGQSTDAAKPIFGQTAGFGTSTTSAFGQTTAGFGLGAQQSTTGGLFGAKPPAFGAPASSAAPGFGFNSTSQSGISFGAAQPAKPFGTATSLFSAPTSQPSTGFGGGLFGQTNAQGTGTGLFNKPAQPTTGFGTAGQTPGFSFNTPASTQSSSLFGAAKPLFGQTSSTTAGFGTTNTFGTTQPGFGSTFGQKPAAPGFGATANTGFGSTFGGLSNQSTSLFGNTQNKPGGLFGTTGTSTGLFGNTGSTFQSGGGFGMGAQPQQQQSLFPQYDQLNTSNIALLTSDPFGDAPHLAGLEPKLRSNTNQAISATDPKELKSLLDSSKKVDMSHGSKLKVTPLRSARDSLFEGVDSTDSSSKNPLSGYTKNSCRRLILKPKKSNESSPSILRTDILNILDNEDKENSKEKGGQKKSLNTDIRVNPLKLNFDVTGQNDTLNTSVETSAQVHSSAVKDLTIDDNRRSTPTQSDDEENQTADETQPKKHSAGIICTRPEYYTLPNLDTLAQYVDENGRCIVKGFTIGRKGYGNVYFPDEMDVAGLNIDELVHFRYREINVYPDESTKPPVGQGLNRRAQVTLDNVYPRRNGTNALVKDVAELLQMNFAEKLRKITEKKGARFVDYRPETGSWVFKVDHFSKYGFNDSDEENENAADSDKKKDKKLESRKEIGALKSKTDENNVDKEKQEEFPLVLVQDKQQEPSKFGLDKDIMLEEEDLSSEEDLLHQSMYVDNMSEDDYRQIPTNVPVDIAYDPYKTSKSIQVMKSTLFAEEDRSSDGAGSHMSIIRQYLDIPDELPRLPVLREETTTRKRPVARPTVYKVYNFGGAEAPSAVMPSRCCVDLALFKGQSFKVGWAKGFNFYSYSNCGELALTTVDKEARLDPLENILIDSLKIVLEESTASLNGDGVPTFKITNGLSYLEKQTELFKRLTVEFNSKESNYLYSVWTLCTALWGPEEDTVSNRRYLLSEWLKSNALSDDGTLKSTFGSTTEAVRAIFTHLTVFKTLDASSIAMDNRLPNLSLLISQLSLTNVTKLFPQEQIESWYSSLASNHISDEMKTVYLLLSGIPSKDKVNIFENIDWKRAFGMHLWYVSPNGSPIEYAIDLYMKAFEESGYAERPNPPYVKGYVEECPFDVLYHIFVLYKTKIHRLSSILNPATHTDNPLDYRLSFLLLQFFLSIKVGIVETCEKEKFYTSFSNQLENLGHFEWAVYVLLYLEDANLKRNLIMGILDRNLTTEMSKDVNDILVNEMHVPAEWIHQVKAEKNLLEDNHFEAFNYFILAKKYIEANDVFVEQILPNLFVNEQFNIIENLLEKLEPGSKIIQKWQNEAGLFSDFLRLQGQILSFKPEALMKLQMQLSSICDRIASFPLKTDQQKLCIAEMSKRLASLYKELCKTSNKSIFKESYTNFVESLVMPPDFKQTEGFYLINYFYDLQAISGRVRK